MWQPANIVGKRLGGGGTSEIKWNPTKAEKGHNRRYEACCANDRFSIRKRTLCAAAPNDGTWPIPAIGAGRPLRLTGALRQAKPIPGRDSLYEYPPWKAGG